MSPTDETVWKRNRIRGVASDRDRGYLNAALSQPVTFIIRYQHPRISYRRCRRSDSVNKPLGYRDQLILQIDHARNTVENTIKSLSRSAIKARLGDLVLL